MESARTMLNKVPEVTIVFWIIKIMSTTVGETGADYLAVHVGLGNAVTAAILVAFLVPPSSGKCGRLVTRRGSTGSLSCSSAWSEHRSPIS